MHLLMVSIALALAIGCRFLWQASSQSWSMRWNRAMGAFLFSPIVLLTSAIAILWMGPRGRMVSSWEGWGSYEAAIAFLTVALIWCVKLAVDGRRSQQQIHQLPTRDVQGVPARLLDQSTPFIAQIGFWKPELVLSQGLLDTLDEEHLNVVLVHEQAHVHYRDTFWFFWLGWLRRLTAWLPQTEAIWQELLVLRELRADRWAAQQIDHLLLAEALFSVVSASQMRSEDLCAAFNDVAMQNRLAERIDALLDDREPPAESKLLPWLWIAIAILPLAIVPFHF